MASDVPLPSPDFIRFLFSNKPKFDCYFVVGNQSQGIPERIGAVKLMLMAHSEVFRLELEDSDLADKEDVKVKDVDPGTFKGMLKYVYGYDTTSDLCFDDADNMLYVAEKYMMKHLKEKLAARLMQLLNPDNICSLLNNPACYKHLELNYAMTEILRFETDRVLASPQFLWMNAEGFLKIVEQDGLAVPEIELWRAVIKWAKHKANSEDGKLLRQEISCLTKHLRLSTFTAEEVCEVVSSGVLSSEEIGTVCLSVTKKEKQALSDFSSESESREILQRIQNVQVELLTLPNLCSEIAKNHEYNFTMLTKKSHIELLPLVCLSKSRSIMDPINWTYKVDCTTTITKVANPHNPDSPTTSEPPITLSFSENVKCGVNFEIPLAIDGKNITLFPDTQYTMKLKVNGSHTCYYKEFTGGIHENDHLKLNKPSVRRGNGYYRYFPCDKLRYTVLPGELSRES